MSSVQKQTAEEFSADWRSFSTAHRIETSELQVGGVSLQWDDGRKTVFHFEWLRDNCPCPACVHPVTREQVFEIVDVPVDLQAASVDITSQGDVTVTWTDGHVSDFGAGWLRAHAYDHKSREERLSTERTVQMWKGSLVIPTFDYDAVMSNDQALLSWLLAARDIGLTRVVNMPTTEDTMERIARRISFIRESNFGVVFEVRTKVEAVNSNAYTALELPHHTDLPTRELQPGLQVLHCLINDAIGGDSTFVDGFAIANNLRLEHPADFELLTEVAVSFRNKAPQSDYRSLAPIIGLNTRGEVSEIRLANWLRAPFDVAERDMPAFYQAYRKFSELTRQPEYIVRQRLSAGEMWCFDNRRTLHARQAFDQASGMRHLRGCYMDRDELLSRIMVLQRSQPAAV